jgi:hypothetical protein
MIGTDEMVSDIDWRDSPKVGACPSLAVTKEQSPVQVSELDVELAEDEELPRPPPELEEEPEPVSEDAEELEELETTVLL